MSEPKDGTPTLDTAWMASAPWTDGEHKAAEDLTLLIVETRGRDPRPTVGELFAMVEHHLSPWADHLDERRYRVVVRAVNASS